MASTGPLHGLTILDLTRVLSGPYCTMLLGDMGARVVKVEPPGGDETRAWGPPFVAGESAYFLSINRNKESVSLDIRQPAGRDVLMRLVDRADVLVENFRPGTLERLSLGYAGLRRSHPRLIYCSISGFGQTGPRATQPGYDAVIQAEGGLMSLTGAADGPPFRCGVAIADLVAGLLAVQGILLALIVRDRTGRGQQVDVSMFDGVVSLLAYHAMTYLANGAVPQRQGNRHATIAPYDTFRTVDGDLVLAIGNDDQFRRFCEAVGLPAVAADRRFASNPDRVVHHDALRAMLAPVLARRPRAHWMAALAEAGVPCGSVRTVADVLADPQVAARTMIEAVEHAAAGTLRMLGVPIRLSETPGRIRSAPPTLGQHTDRVLAELGLDGEAIAALRRDAVI